MSMSCDQILRRHFTGSWDTRGEVVTQWNPWVGERLLDLDAHHRYGNVAVGGDNNEL